MGIWTAMYLVMLRGAELKLGMGVGGRPPSFESIISK